MFRLPKTKKTVKLRKDTTPVSRVPDAVDMREQLVNAGECGPVQRVSLPAEMITAVRGVMLDIDPEWIRPELYAGGAGTAGDRLYNRLVAKWVSHDPLFSKAEVRHSGSGLHALFWFDEPVEIRSAGDRAKWDGVIRAVQRALPTDPTAPGITALTRPVGGINGKCGRKVSVLRTGTPVTVDEVLMFFARLKAKPFATVAGLLYGGDRIAPCPVCRGKGSELAAADRVGHCYGGCGTVTLADLYGTVMVPSTQGEG